MVPQAVPKLFDMTGPVTQWTLLALLDVFENHLRISR